MITAAQIAAASDELDYVSYCEAVRAGESEEAIAGYFGVRREALQARYWREYNAGARTADDALCPGCSARGHSLSCPTCSSRERL